MTSILRNMPWSHALVFLFQLTIVLAVTSVTLSTALCEPGDIYQKRRAAVLAKFDANKDGRLDNAEREAARAAKKQEALRGGSRGPMFQMPPEIVEMYDKDGDGQLNAEESTAASEGMRASMEAAQKEYDTNKDGDLDDGEREKLAEAISSGKVKGVPRMFGGMFRGNRGMRGGGMGGGRGGRGGRGGGGRMGMFGGGGPIESPLAEFDKDKDGRLSEAELDLARKAGMGSNNR